MQNPVHHETLSIACHVGPRVDVFIYSNFLGPSRPQAHSVNVKWDGLVIFH